MAVDTRGSLASEFRAVAVIWRYIVYRAYIGRKLSIRRSVLGFLFEPIMLLVSTFCIALVWNKIFGKGGGQEFIQFFVYVLTSFALWNLISGLVNSTSASLLGRVKQITNTQDPIVAGVFTDIISNALLFAMVFPVVLIFVLLFSDYSVLGLLLFLYGTVLILLTAVGCGLTIGIACLFVGDLRAIINSVMRVAFLLTPIIWQVERLGEYKKYIYFNPFYNYLAVCRDGLLHGAVGSKELFIATGLTMFMVLAGLWTLNVFKARLRERAFAL
jgi:ABC-type polysaccharide/polyol phosphate export permease